MSDEYMEDLEPSPEEVAATSGFGDLPKQTQDEIRKLRNENQSLRNRAKERETEVLAAKYGDEVMELVPVEVTDYARRAEIAETLMARLASSSTEPQAPAAPEEAVVEPPTPDEQALAAAIGGPASGTSNVPVEYSPKEILAIGRKDPARADEIVRQMQAANPEAFKREFGLPK